MKKNSWMPSQRDAFERIVQYIALQTYPIKLSKLWLKNTIALRNNDKIDYWHLLDNLKQSKEFVKAKELSSRPLGHIALSAALEGQFSLTLKITDQNGPS